MSLLKTILESQGGAVAGQLAKQFGLDANQASSVLGQLVPALSKTLPPYTRFVDLSQV